MTNVNGEDQQGQNPQPQNQPAADLHLGGGANYGMHAKSVRTGWNWGGFWIGLVAALVGGVVGLFAGPMLSIILAIVGFLVGCFLIPPFIWKETHEITRTHTHD